MAVAAASVGGIAALLGDLREDLHVGDVRAGLLVGAGFLASFVAQVTLAPLADRGRGPRLLQGGIGLASIALLSMALIDTYWVFLAARAALGFGVGLILPGVRRAAVVLDPGRVGENLGKLIGGEVVGYILGPVVAAGAAEIVGLSFSFAVFGVALACLAPVAFRLPPDPGRKDTSGAGSWNLLRRPAFVGALLLMGGYVFPFGAVQTVLPLQLTDHDISRLTIGLVFAALATPIVVAAPLGGRAADRVGALRVAVAGMVLVCLVTPLLGIESTPAVLLIVVGVIGAADGFGITAGQAVVTQTVPEERQAAALGLMGATEVLVAGLVAIPATALYHEAGEATLWVVTAIATLAVVLLGASVVARDRAGGTSPDRA